MDRELMSSAYLEQFWNGEVELVGNLQWASRVLLKSAISAASSSLSCPQTPSSPGVEGLKGERGLL